MARRLCPALVALSLLTLTSRAQELVLWREAFEGNADLWDANRGVWDFGEPSNSAGPKAIEGKRCASVGLRSNYPANADTSFVRLQRFTVPDAAQNPRLRFYHWYSIYAGDYGQVRIRAEGSEPKALSGRFDANSDWSRASLPLREFAGKNVQIEFHFFSDGGNPFGGTAPGWFIDDIALVVGEDTFSGFEGFEVTDRWSFNPWTSSQGNWQIGKPSSGLATAHGGENCAGVTLSGGYFSSISSSLVAPPFIVPAADQHPRLSFFHWFSIYAGDFGQVRIRETGGTNELASEQFFANSSWARTDIALEQYAGKEVQMEFYFYSDGGNPFGGVAPGWFVDDIQLRTGDYEFRGKENFEGGLGEWYSTRGNWQVGTPKDLPLSAHEGTNCAGVVLTGGYPATINSYLVSPPFLVPNDSPRLRFYHWYSIYAGDFGQVWIRELGGTNQAVSERFSGNSDWSRTTVPLDNFAGKTVQIAFYFESDGGNPFGGVAPGWFIDEVEILPAFPNRWPILQPIASQIAQLGETVSFTATATDPDSSQIISYSIDLSTKPENASIDAETGAFTWLPASIQNSTNAHYVRIRATDNGTPPRSTSQLVPIHLPGGMRLYSSHAWETPGIKVSGAVPGLNYTNYSVLELKGTNVWNNSFPFTIVTNFSLKAQGEAVGFGELGPRAGNRFFFVHGEKP